MGLDILKTPLHSPQANAFCERLGGSIRREGSDFPIPLRTDLPQPLHRRRLGENSGANLDGLSLYRPPTWRLRVTSQSNVSGRYQRSGASAYIKLASLT